MLVALHVCICVLEKVHQVEYLPATGCFYHKRNEVHFHNRSQASSACGRNFFLTQQQIRACGSWRIIQSIARPFEVQGARLLKLVGSACMLGHGTEGTAVLDIRALSFCLFFLIAHPDDCTCAGTIPASLGSLTELRLLHLSSNTLQGERELNRVY